MIMMFFHVQRGGKEAKKEIVPVRAGKFGYNHETRILNAQSAISDNKLQALGNALDRLAH
jgi:hypothetical protein